jgi:hypothetical protein
MTYAERRHALITSAAYSRAIKIIAVACACYAIVIGGVVAISADRSIPSDPSGSVGSELLHWVGVAALMFLACLAELNLLAPALMTEARLQKLARRR